MSRIDALVDWLIDGAKGVTSADGIVERLGVELCAAGIPIDRLAVYVTTLHPSVAGRSFRWSPGAPIDVGEATHAMFLTDMFKNSPFNDVVQLSAEKRVRISKEAPGTTYPVIDNLRREGFTDYLALPMIFTSGEVHVITFTTKSERGFTDEDLDALRRVVRPLARIAEIFALRRTASTLLSTYVGRNSGAQILGGRIKKGDFETLRAVIWFSDLRGFTALSATSSTREVIDTLNRVFECQVPAIERHGGEVLKFMGDGLLAIFPLAASDDPARVAEHATLAAEEAFAAIEALPPLRIGLALHVGELAYGNIGGSNRLDFTAIGPAVNVAARLEGLTSRLGKKLVFSEELARLSKRPTDDLGTFELKGVPEPTRVFALRT